MKVLPTPLHIKIQYEIRSDCVKIHILLNKCATAHPNYPGRIQKRDPLPKTGPTRRASLFWLAAEARGGAPTAAFIQGDKQYAETKTKIPNFPSFAFKTQYQRLSLSLSLSTCPGFLLLRSALALRSCAGSRCSRGRTRWPTRSLVSSPTRPLRLLSSLPLPPDPR